MSCVRWTDINKVQPLLWLTEEVEDYFAQRCRFLEIAKRAGLWPSNAAIECCIFWMLQLQQELDQVESEDP